MSNINNEISQFISKLSNNVEPIKEICEKYIEYCSIIDGDYSGDLEGNIISYFEVIRIWHNPNIYKDNYMFTLNKGIDPKWVTLFKEKTNIDIPKMYVEFLVEINGCCLFDQMLDCLNLFGLPPEMYYPPFYYKDKQEIKRKKYNCEDLEIMNTTIKNDFMMGRHIFNGFYIGHRNYNDDEHYIGYFIENDCIFAVNENKEIINKYSTLIEFLSNEIKTTENYYFSKNKEFDLCKMLKI